jgi:hypothetical protein
LANSFVDRIDNVPVLLLFFGLNKLAFCCSK